MAIALLLSATIFVLSIPAFVKAAGFSGENSIHQLRENVWLEILARYALAAIGAILASMHKLCPAFCGLGLVAICLISIATGILVGN